LPPNDQVSAGPADIDAVVIDVGVPVVDGVHI